jgi:hypothetical protein
MVEWTEMHACNQQVAVDWGDRQWYILLKSRILFYVLYCLDLTGVYKEVHGTKSIPTAIPMKYMSPGDGADPSRDGRAFWFEKILIFYLNLLNLNYKIEVGDGEVTFFIHHLVSEFTPENKKVALVNLVRSSPIAPQGQLAQPRSLDREVSRPSCPLPCRAPPPPGLWPPHLTTPQAQSSLHLVGHRPWALFCGPHPAVISPSSFGTQDPMDAGERLLEREEDAGRCARCPAWYPFRPRSVVSSEGKKVTLGHPQCCHG